MEKLELAKKQNTKKIKELEITSESAYEHTHHLLGVLSLLAEGYQGDGANQFMLQKEDVFQYMLNKNSQYRDLKHDEYQKERSGLHSKEALLEEEYKRRNNDF